MLLVSVALAACSSGGSPAQGSASAPAFPTPLATSLPTSAGTWATVAMGRLEQPLNTFWQLLMRPTGGGSWSNHVEATAVATNGGLVLASSPGASLIAGVRPSNLLTFSPLILTASAGRSWSSGLLGEPLAPRPDALAASSPGHALALVNAKTGTQAMTSVGSLSSWRTVVTQSRLASTSAGRTCGLAALTAVAYLTGIPLVGASCAHEGVVGLFRERAGGWQLLQGEPPGGLQHDRVEVLALHRTGRGICALLGVSSEAGPSSLIAAWYAAGRWTSSQPLYVGAPARLASFGPTAANGMFVLLSRRSRPAQLVSANFAGAPWQQLPAPPKGTVTAAFGATGGPEALAVEGTVLKIWSLRSRRWLQRQTLDVHIEYGSSE
jgi:hypothetical protein